MSYCRFGRHSDVYMYEHCNLGLICEHCDFTGEAVKLKDEIDAIKHLYEHIKEGHRVLPSAIAELWEDWIKKKTQVKEQQC